VTKASTHATAACQSILVSPERIHASSLTCLMERIDETTTSIVLSF
jgi:hypothetical protein